LPALSSFSDGVAEVRAGSVPAGTGATLSVQVEASAASRPVT
jgi:hypothetical protein